MTVHVTALDHTGDLGFEILAPTPEQVLARAGREMFALILDTDAVAPRETREVVVDAEDHAERLYQWLRALLTLFCVEEFVAREVDVVLDGTRLVGTLRGETFDDERHPFHTELKAVTLHHLRFEHDDDGWRGRVVFDV